MTLTLSPRRVGLLMRHDLNTQKKSLITGFAVIGGLALAAHLITGASGGGTGSLTSLFVNVLVIGGYIVSSMAFGELHDPKSGIHYMMLPGSSLEKYAAKLLLTAVGWTAAVLVLFTVATAIGTALGSVFFATNPGVLVPTTRAIWLAVASYLVTNSIFLFGSIYFRKVAFLKTVLAALGVAFSLGIVYVLAARIVFAPVFTGLFEIREAYDGVDPMNSLRLSQAEGEALLRVLKTIGDIATWVIVPVFFWIAGVLRLRETEV